MVLFCTSFCNQKQSRYNCQYLLFKGTRYDIKNNSHKTAFIDACQFKTKKFIQSVLSKENVSFPVDDICRDYPLHYLPLVEYLLAKGFDVDEKDDRERTPLFYACANDQLPIVYFLIYTGADMEAQDIDLQTPLHIASLCDKFDIVQCLYLIGAKLDVKNKDGKTPYDIACSKEGRELLK